MSVEKMGQSALQQLEHLIKRYRILTLCFFVALVIEIVLLLFFFPLLIKSAFFAITLAALLITLFSFYTLRNYQASEKEEALRELIQKYLKGVHSLSESPKTPAETRQNAADACLALASLFKEAPQTPSFFRRKYRDLMGGEEEQKFKELLFRRALEELAGQVRLHPCDVAPHIRLAETYFLMARICRGMEREKLLKKGVEELKILLELAPGNPQVLEKLAAHYGELGDLLSQTAVLEQKLALEPHHPETLFQLGCLYFSQGHTSKGFKIYETLKIQHPGKSDQLMSYYR